jgi:hypothetical protein
MAAEKATAEKPAALPHPNQDTTVAWLAFQTHQERSRAVAVRASEFSAYDTVKLHHKIGAKRC